MYLPGLRVRPLDDAARRDPRHRAPLARVLHGGWGSVAARRTPLRADSLDPRGSAARTTSDCAATSYRRTLPRHGHDAEMAHATPTW